jgi:hypothetical protein
MVGESRLPDLLRRVRGMEERLRRLEERLGVTESGDDG